MSRVSKKKKVRRVVLGIGHPWFLGRWIDNEFDTISLLKSDGAPAFKATIDPQGIGGWNKIRLIAEVIE